MQWQGMLLYYLTPHLKKVFPLQDLATVAEPQHGLESIDEDGIQRLLLRD